MKKQKRTAITTTTPSAASLRRTVYRHFASAGRSRLPWRATSDPYAILVSELMLQQTQIARVIPKYELFLRRFPTTASLAKAPLREVLRFWQGLGYNRRAKALHDLAKEVTRRYGGKLPSDKELLEKLPGVGPYSASAVLVFAFNKQSVMIETNIRTVYTHFFFPDAKKVTDAELIPLIEATMDRRNPRRWFSALMDYGSYLKESGVHLNARSAHYVRQSKFEGSRRQLRGLLVRLLLEKPRTVRVLAKESRRTLVEVTEELGRLQKEKLISKRKRLFVVAS